MRQQRIEEEAETDAAETEYQVSHSCALPVCAGKQSQRSTNYPHAWVQERKQKLAQGEAERTAKRRAKRNKKKVGCMMVDCGVRLVYAGLQSCMSFG